MLTAGIVLSIMVIPFIASVMRDVFEDRGRRRRRMLHFLMTHPERVHSRAQLLDEIWGDHVFVEERTVDVHIRRLRQALESSKLDCLVDTVRGTGYRFRRSLA